MASLSIGSVIGPRLSTFSDLIPPSPFHEPIAGGPDLVLVREDGLRVAIEVTASTGKGFRAKVERWARVLEATRFDSSGLVVVFLVAPAPAALQRH